MISGWSFSFIVNPWPPADRYPLNVTRRGRETLPFSIIQLMISILLFFILFFGIGFILNMLLRLTWIMTFIYPIVVIFIVDNIPFITYFRVPKEAFQTLGTNLSSLAPADITVLLSGLAGTIVAGFTMKALRKRGYRMF